MGKEEKKDTYNRSRMMIVEYLIQFCCKTYSSNGVEIPDFSNNLNGFICSYSANSRDIPIGSLCRLMNAPSTKYYLSWYLGRKDGYHLLQSIEDHEVAKWGNVSIQPLPIKHTEGIPQFKYTDRQFNVQDQWDRTVNKEYNYISCWSKFSEEDDSITISLRQKFTSLVVSKTFPSWKELTTVMMQEFVTEIKEGKYEWIDTEEGGSKG